MFAEQMSAAHSNQHNKHHHITHYLESGLRLLQYNWIIDCLLRERKLLLITYKYNIFQLVILVRKVMRIEVIIFPQLKQG